MSDPANYDFRLYDNSPCLNAGTADGSSADSATEIGWYQGAGLSPSPWSSSVYVSGSGKTFANGGRGTSANPFRTITEALTYITGSGSTLNILTGTYNTAAGETFPITINDTNITTISGAGYDDTTGAIIDSTGTTDQHTLSLAVAGLTVSGLKVVQAASAAGVNGVNIAANNISLSNTKVMPGSTADDSAKGVMVSGVTGITINACIVDGSLSDYSEGMRVQSGSATITNSIVYTCDIGFLLLSAAADATMTLTNCVAYNCNTSGSSWDTGFLAADSSGSYVATLNVKNSIASACGTGVKDAQIGGTAAVITSTYNCYNNTTDYGAGTISSKTGDLTATNPFFINAGSNNFRLQSKNRGYANDSPCIDSGTSSGAPSTDFAGTSRPQGSAFDIGDYEALDKSTYHSSLTKSANKKKATAGDVLRYTIAISNTSSQELVNTKLIDNLPKGFKFLSGTYTLNNVSQSDPSGTTSRTFTSGTLLANTTYTLRYRLVVGSGVDFGKYTNTATLYSTSDNLLSGTAQETVTIVANPLFYAATIIGKVFQDQNQNGVQDNNEQGLTDIELVTEDGFRIKTDPYGRYHINNLKPQTKLIALDTKTLPSNSKLTTENPVLLTPVTEGVTLKANFGVYIPEEPKK